MVNVPELSWNSDLWDRGYNWDNRGEEWSETWGGSEPQWFGSLYPRLHGLIPTKRLLEIAPGFGRWTKFLIPACQEYLGIDLSANCISACQNLFRAASHARFCQNDGLSLSAAEGLFDVVFSFDSLVHVESDVMASYVPQILQKLSPRGVAFLHHSNLAALPVRPKHTHARGETVSAKSVAELVSTCGGKIILQELVDWGESLEPLDCLTLFGRAQHPHLAPVRIVNQRFMDEANHIRRVQAPYSRIGPQWTVEMFDGNARCDLTAECAALREQVRALYSSSSWRLTSPLRAMKALIAKAR
jgi:2-polyprenyl-3-methyl-5-hydroxy-6-metoxy-1,4-benzoquinol methylase